MRVRVVGVGHRAADEGAPAHVERHRVTPSLEYIEGVSQDGVALAGRLVSQPFDVERSD